MVVVYNSLNDEMLNLPDSIQTIDLNEHDNMYLCECGHSRFITQYINTDMNFITVKQYRLKHGKLVESGKIEESTLTLYSLDNTYELIKVFNRGSKHVSIDTIHVIFDNTSHMHVNINTAIQEIKTLMYNKASFIVSMQQGVFLFGLIKFRDGTPEVFSTQVYIDEPIVYILYKLCKEAGITNME